jgi:hypothetical protein
MSESRENYLVHQHQINVTLFKLDRGFNFFEENDYYSSLFDISDQGNGWSHTSKDFTVVNVIGRHYDFFNNSRNMDLLADHICRISTAQVAAT